MLEVKKQLAESPQALTRRFARGVQQSGILLQSRKIRYFARAENHNKRKTDALRRIRITAEREYLKKIGRLPEEEFKFTRR